MNLGYEAELRRLRLEDRDLTFKWRNDPRIFSTTRQSCPLHWDRHEKWFKQQAEDDSVSMFGVSNGVEGPLVGVVGLTSIDMDNRRAEFSCYVDPDLHGNGYGSKALKSLLAYAFMIKGLHLVWGETFAFNPAKEIFESLGMTRHGTRPDFYYREGKFINSLLYGITEAKWRQSGYSSQASLLGSLSQSGTSGTESV